MPIFSRPYIHLQGGSLVYGVSHGRMHLHCAESPCPLWYGGTIDWHCGANIYRGFWRSSIILQPIPYLLEEEQTSQCLRLKCMLAMDL